MWPKFRNSGISMREVILNWILSGFNQKNNFFWGVSWFKLYNLELGLRMALKFNNSVAKVLIISVRKFWGSN